MLLPKVALTSLLLIIAWFGTAHAQKVLVRGSVTDSTSKKIAGAVITLGMGKDTLNTSTDDNGAFLFGPLKKGTYSIKARSIGHSSYAGQFSLTGKEDTVILPVIVLKLVSKELPEVKVKVVKPVVFKIDTVEYNTEAFVVRQDDRVEDLLKQLPGLEMDADGNVSSQGKQLYKLRVDGHDFFTGNVQEFISKLPARIFDKIQVIDDYGDDAAFTGIKKGEPQKILNLVTKPGMNWGQFGSVGLKGGTNHLIGGSAGGNYWKGTRQIGANFASNRAQNTGGINTSNNASVSYNDRLSNKLSIGSSYSFSNSKSTYANSFFQQTNSQLGTLYNNSNSQSLQSGVNHNLNVNGSLYGKKSFLSFSVAAGTGDNTGNSNSSSVQTGFINQTVQTSTISTGSSPRINAGVNYGRRFAKPGRAMNINLSIGTSSSNNVQHVNNRISYPGTQKRDSTLNRVLDTHNAGTSANLGITYGEPINSHSSINASYSLSATLNRNKLVTNAAATGETLHYVDSLSNDLRSGSINQHASVSYNYQQKKFNFSQSLGIQQSKLDNTNSNAADVHTSVVNFSPSTFFNYLFNNQNRLNLSYSNFSSQPTPAQLQSTRDTRNLQNIVIGNPDLKPSYSHSANLNFSHTTTAGQYLSLQANGSFIRNQIVSNTVFVKDTAGNLRQETHFFNASGNYRTGGSYMYSFGLGSATQKKVRIGLSGSVNYAHNVSFTDNIKGIQKGLSMSQSMSTGTYFNKISINFSAQYNNSYNRYTAGNGINNHFQSLSLNTSGSMNLAAFRLNLTASKQFNSGFASQVSSNPLIINATANKYFDKKRLSLALQASDLLNQANQVQHFVSGNSITDNRTHNVTRYFTLNASWNLSRFAGGR